MDRQRGHEEKLTASSGLRRFRFGILLTALLGMLVYTPLIELVAPEFPSRILLGLVFLWGLLLPLFGIQEKNKVWR